MLNFLMYADGYILFPHALLLGMYHSGTEFSYLISFDSDITVFQRLTTVLINVLSRLVNFVG